MGLPAGRGAEQQIVRDLVIPAGADRLRFELGIVADFWMVTAYDQVGTEIRVWDGAGTGPFRIRGTGQAAWNVPKDSVSSELLFSSDEVVSRIVSVYASKGLPPPTIVPPVSFASPSTVEVTAVTAAPTDGVNQNNTVFTHPHPGGPLLVLGGQDSGAAIRSMTSVSLGGLAAARIAFINSAIAFHRLEAWLHLNVPAGPVQITITWDIAGTDRNAFALSFPASAFAGGPTTLAWNDALPHNIAVAVAVERAVAIGICNSAGNFSETGGAVLLAEILDGGALNHVYRVYLRRAVGATETFVFDNVGAVSGQAIGVALGLPNA